MHCKHTKSMLSYQTMRTPHLGTVFPTPSSKMWVHLEPPDEGLQKYPFSHIKLGTRSAATVLDG